MKYRPINQNNKKNIYCGHCEFFKTCSTCVSKCSNPESPRVNNILHYWNRCKAFTWRKDAEYVKISSD